MATTTATLFERLQEKQQQPGGGNNNIPKSKRKLQKHLRSAGLEYISRTGKIIPAKRVADELCQCPQKCDERVPAEARQRLFAHFYGLGEADQQNQFLRQNMDLRARLNVPESATTGSGRPPRRITCKYLVPLLPHEEDTVEVCQKAFVSAFVITTKRVRLQREKLIASLGLNSYSSHNRSKNNNNAATANHNIAAMVESLKKKEPNLHLQKFNNDVMEYTSSNSSSSLFNEPKSPELPSMTITAVGGGGGGRPHHNNSKSRRLVDNPLVPLGLLVPDGVTIAPVYTPDHDRDIAIVHNFFSNQLWKPEYIGAYS